MIDRRAWATGLFVLSLSLAAAAQAPRPPARERFEQAMALIQENDATGEPLAQAMAIAADLEKTATETGYFFVLRAEVISTFKIDQNANPKSEAADALSLVNLAMRIQPDLPAAHATKARILARMGDLDQAQLSIDRALLLQPDMASAVYQQAEVLKRRGRIKEAERWYRRFAEVAPSPRRAANGYEGIAMMYWAQRDAQGRARQPEKVREAYQQAHELNPEAIWSRINFAVFLNEDGQDLDQAIQLAQKVLTMGDVPMARRQLAIARYQQLLAKAAATPKPQLRKQIAAIAQETGMALVEASDPRYADDLIVDRLRRLQAQAR